MQNGRISLKRFEPGNLQSLLTTGHKSTHDVLCFIQILYFSRLSKDTIRELYHIYKLDHELFNYKPDLSHVRVIGARTFVQVPARERDKLMPISKPGRLIGYEEHSKGYRILMDGPHNQIRVSRDVTFAEADCSRQSPETPAATLPESELLELNLDFRNGQKYFEIEK